MFKTLSILLLTLIFVYSCDTPQNNRRSYVSDTGSFSQLDDGGDGDQDFDGNPPVDPPGGPAPETPDPGYENCNISPSHYSSVIGYVGVCQHNTMETELRVYFQSQDNGDRTCLVPTNRQGDGTSSYLGQAVCSTHQADTTYRVVLAKDRPGSQGYPLNGVMFLKQSMLNEYFTCMDAYNLYLGGCYGSPSTCQTQAQNYQYEICNAFKSKYTGKYIDIAL